MAQFLQSRSVPVLIKIAVAFVMLVIMACIVLLLFAPQRLAQNMYFPLTEGSYWIYTKNKKIAVGVTDKIVLHDMWRYNAGQSGEKDKGFKQVAYRQKRLVASTQQFGNVFLARLQQIDDAEFHTWLFVQKNTTLFIREEKEINLDEWRKKVAL